MEGIIIIIARARILLFLIIILICFFYFDSKNSQRVSAVDYEVPIYKIFISENDQRIIWMLCEKNKLSYELILAIYSIEGIDNYQIDNVKAYIENLTYYRDYWTKQGYPDEVVFDLMLLSKQRGINGSILFMKYHDSYNDDFVKKVTEYKYYLEQSLDEANNNLVAS